MKKNELPISLLSLKREAAKIPSAIRRISSRIKPNFTCGTITISPERNIS